MSIRSAFWMGEKILVGTNAGEVFEVLATDKDKPKTIVQVQYVSNRNHLLIFFFFEKKIVQLFQEVKSY